MSDLMKDPMILRSIIMDHYEYPRNHELTKEDGYVQKHMASESCIDDIYVQSRIRDGVVEDVRFDGVACTISTASTSIMSELLKGKRGEAGGGGGIPQCGKSGQPDQMRHHRLEGDGGNDRGKRGAS